MATIKIIIVGAGICGMADYIFLRRALPETCDIKIYETYDEPERSGKDLTTDTTSPTTAPIGGGLGLAPNGLKEMEMIDAELYKLMLANGYPARRFQINGSPNFALGGVESVYKDKPMLMTMRQSVWKVLRTRVPDSAFHWKARVTDVRQDEGKRPEVVLADGSVESADLIVGADGLRSTVRTHIVGEKFPAHYEGLIGVGGFAPSSYLPPLPADGNMKSPYSPVVMTFGQHGFVGYSPCDRAPPSKDESAGSVGPDYLPPYGDTAMWWSTYELLEEPDVKSLSLESVRAQLIERHGSWKDPCLHKFITEGEIQGLYATYTVDKLPIWHRGCVVLTGDAAHAVPASAGQGVSQSLEDSHALASLLVHYLNNVDPNDSTALSTAISSACAKLTAMRKPRVDRILDSARRMSNKKRKQGALEVWLTYAAMFVFTRLSVSGMKKELGEYDVDAEVKKVVNMTDAEYAAAYLKSIK